MKKNALCLFMWGVATMAYPSEEVLWKWVDINSEQFVSQFKNAKKNNIFFCRDRKTLRAGVVDLENGACHIVLDNAFLESYQLHLSDNNQQFQWYDKESRSCALTLKSTTADGTEGDWSNCYDRGEAYCGIYQNETFYLGVLEHGGKTCIGSNGNSSNEFHYYQFEIPKYNNIEYAVIVFFSNVLTLALWRMTLSAMAREEKEI